jgi:DNA-binding beta-propeller fold protein YncE
VVAIDPSNGVVVADVRVEALPGPVAAGIDRSWVGTGARLLIGIDVRSRRIIGRFGLPAPAYQIAAGDGIVWIANDYDGTVSRLDERVGFVSRPFRPQRWSTGRLALATGFGSLWVGSQDGRVARVDPTRDRLIATIRGIRTPQALAAGEGAVWLIEATRAAVVRIDPRTNRVVLRLSLGALPTAVAVAAGSAWVSTSDGRIWRIDPAANRIRATITTGGSPIAIEPAGPFLWVAYADGELRGIDPASNEVRQPFESSDRSQTSHPPTGCSGRRWASLLERVPSQARSTALVPAASPAPSTCSVVYDPFSLRFESGSALAPQHKRKTPVEGSD